MFRTKLASAGTCPFFERFNERGKHNERVCFQKEHSSGEQNTRRYDNHKIQVVSGLFLREEVRYSNVPTAAGQHSVGGLHSFCLAPGEAVLRMLRANAVSGGGPALGRCDVKLI